MQTAELIVHADWGSSPGKRWLCVAERVADTYRVLAPEPVGDLQRFWPRLLKRAAGRATLIGFDFPIGLPRTYAEKAGVAHFPRLLAQLGQHQWSAFFGPAAAQKDISIHRPFYPKGTKGVRVQHLLDGLGLDHREDLLRRCERATEGRSAASPLFWTLGPKQAGRAAIIGWRDVLQPGLQSSAIHLRLWPFDGSLGELLGPGRFVVAETYPAEACLHVGLTPPGRGWAKTRQGDRQACAPTIRKWAASNDITLAAALEQALCDGFGTASGGEDPFDAMLGALSMVAVATGLRPDGCPDDAIIRNVEGWILGSSARADGPTRSV